MKRKGFVVKEGKEGVALGCKETGMVKGGGRKGVFGRVALVGVVLGVVLALGLPEAGWAATITVTSTADVANDFDGTCTLREAIRAANSDTAVDGCTAGSGTDTIEFAAGTNGTPITLMVSGASENAAATGDLDITQDVTITGNGPANTLIEACTVDQKTAVCPGGQGIEDRVFDVRSGTVSISGVTICNGRSSQGSGIRNDGTLTLTNATLSNNLAFAGSGFTSLGGGISNSRTLTVNTSTLSGNRASGPGGGIFNHSSGRNATFTLTNSTLSNNSAIQGGGIFNGSDSAEADVFVTSTLTNSTLSNNSATGEGGGFDNFGTFNLKNTLVANNSAPTGPDCRGSVTSQGNNLIENSSGCFGFGGTDLTGQDPTLGPLADNGGPTPTHALLTGSPAIDAGTNTGCPATDQRGVARPQDGDGDSIAFCDIGAYEVADADGDGFNESQDCDDTEASIHPGAPELCNGVDDNCDETVDEGFDVGANCTAGVGACQNTGTKGCTTDGSATECSATPGTPSPETCNNIDDDCDGAVDESPTNPLQPLSQPCYSGPAGTQGVGVCQAGTQSCSGGSFGACVGELTPSAEVCDGQDNDCDSQTDEGVTSTFYQDADSDGFGNSASSTQACSAPAGYVSNSTDCNDANTAIHPGATEVCDGVDNDCDGTVDDSPSDAGLGCTTGLPGVCSAGTTVCSSNGTLVCNQTFQPSAEVCGDGIDQDCDGQDTLCVSIDIKPGSFPNSINLGSGGTVPVAILSTPTFDATTVNPQSVTLASAPVKLKGNGTSMASVEQVNGDGLLDLVVHVLTEALQLSESDTVAVLEGQTFGGTPIMGTDTVRVVP